jgi:hypothetical protein
MVHGGLRPLPCVVPLGARQRLVQAPGALVPLPCVWWRGARQRMVNVPCAAPGARQRDYSGSPFRWQIDLVFLFFLFLMSKNSQKHIHDIYITISITGIIYITTCIIYVTISITSIIYNNIHHKSTPKSEVHRQVHTKVHNSSTVHIVHHSS